MGFLLRCIAHHTTLFVNGRKAGAHAGSYDGFSFDITKYLTGGPTVLVVAVHDANDGRVPSGKSGPRGDYTFCSGIWQTVWIEPVSKTHIDNIRLLPDVENSRIKIRAVSSGSGSWTAVASDGNNEVARATSVAGGWMELGIPSPKLWSPDHPFLYDLTIIVRDAAGATTDVIKSYFGMRDSSRPPPKKP